MGVSNIVPDHRSIAQPAAENGPDSTFLDRSGGAQGQEPTYRERVLV